jgi:hypothetical protein
VSRLIFVEGLLALAPRSEQRRLYVLIQERGLSGLDGLLAYWRAHADLCGAIVDRLDVPKLVLDVDTDDWSERRRRICDFVDVPFEGETFPETAELAPPSSTSSRGPCG